MAYINDLFDVLITKKSIEWQDDWAVNYKAYTSFIKELRDSLEKNPTLPVNDPSHYQHNKWINSYEKFLKSWLYDKNNGVASRGRSVLSKEDLKKLLSSDQFTPLVQNIIIDPSEDNHKALEKMWTSLVTAKNPVLINRAFAACAPQSLSSTVDNGKFGAVVQFLRKYCGYATPPQVSAQWYPLNKDVTAWLDQQLATEKQGYTPDEWNIYRNIFIWFLYEYDPSDFDFKKQLVKYGAPGTGKTYTCKRDASSNFVLWKSLYYPTYTKSASEHISTVQFHPSFTYEDFIEGIRPVLIQGGSTVLKLVNGVFKDFCKRAALWEMDFYRQIPDLKEASFEDIMVADVRGKLKGEIWSFLSDIKDGETPLSRAIPPFFFIIDEINRAELSRVFGELMYCLEYRGYKGKIKTQYSSLVPGASDEAAYWFENGTNYFFIPHNVYLMGTMNNIDRSVESFDFALRRRFKWIEVEPNYEVIAQDLPEELEPVIECLSRLNAKIEADPLLGKDYRIGQSYFMNGNKFINRLPYNEYRNTIWSQSIKPLLEEYLRGTGETAEVNNKMTSFYKSFME